MRDASRVQIERDIARCRVILSIAAPFAVYLDPTEPTLFFQLTGGLFLIDPYALAVLVLHLIYSVTVYFIVSRPAVSLNRVAVLSMTADVLFGAAVALVTEGTNSPYYIFFLFAVLAAGLRGRRRTALIVTSASLAVYLALILVSRPEGLGFYVTRAVYLAITGYLVAALGRQRHILETGFHGLARSLHDGYAQALAGINLRLETLSRAAAAGRQARTLEELTELQDSVKREYDDLRAYVRSLAGLDATPSRRGDEHDPVPACAPRSRARSPVIEHAMQIAMEGARNVAPACSGSRSACITVSPARRRRRHRHRRRRGGILPDDEPPWSIASRAARDRWAGADRRATAPPAATSSSRCPTSMSDGHPHPHRDRRRPRALPPGAQVDAQVCSPTSSSSARRERVADVFSPLLAGPLRHPAARPADGPQRPRRHRGAGRRVPVVVVTASERPSDAVAALRAGARAVVFKRFAIETLMDADARRRWRRRLDAAERCRRRSCRACCEPADDVLSPREDGDRAPRRAGAAERRGRRSASRSPRRP